MKRWLAMAALGVVLLSTPVWGQRGGRGGMACPLAVRVAVDLSRTEEADSAMAQLVPALPSAGVGSILPSDIRIIILFYPGHYSWGLRYPWALGYGYGWYAYPPWGLSVGFGDSYSYPAQPPPAPSYADPDNSSAYAQNSQIQQDEIDRLSHEVHRLREQESRQAESALSPPQSKAQVHAETVLVFRDKHTEEIQNYAVVGDVLWVFTELRARKFPIANLDVSATTKANDDRGVDFRLPK